MGPEPWAYLNGRQVSLSQAAVSVLDGGFVQGVTVAEQLRTFRGELFRLESHLTRLARSLAIVGIDPGIELAELGRIATELARQNAERLHPDDDQNVTMFITPGVYGSYAEATSQRGPTVCVHTQPLPFANWAAKYETGESLVVTDVRQVPATCWPPELKCRSRMHYYLADRQAQAREAGARALLLDEQEHVTEASTANILVYSRAEGLISPPLERILPGVTVGVLEELAERIGVPFVHRDLSVSECTAADEMLLCSTSPCVLSVTRLNGRPIGAGQPGPIAARLRQTFDALVGLDIAAQARRFAARSQE